MDDEPTGDEIGRSRLYDEQRRRIERLERQLAAARAEIGRKDAALQAVLDADMAAITEMRDVLRMEPPPETTKIMEVVREALAAPVQEPPLDELQRLGQEYDKEPAQEQGRE